MSNPKPTKGKGKKIRLLVHAFSCFSFSHSPCKNCSISRTSIGFVSIPLSLSFLQLPLILFSLKNSPCSRDFACFEFRNGAVLFQFQLLSRSRSSRNVKDDFSSFWALDARAEMALRERMRTPFTNHDENRQATSFSCGSSALKRF